MDIRKLQRAIVDGLEDVKAQHIAVFNTEALSPLFERVIIASGTSNRQTKALAASVRDAVKARGLPVLRTEGEEHGEWIIVDCGAAVAHIMQPSVRDYYRLEEIWGGKPVKLKRAEVATSLPKASESSAPVRKAAAAPRTARPAAAGAKRAASAPARSRSAAPAAPTSSGSAARSRAAASTRAGPVAPKRGAAAKATVKAAPSAKKPAAQPRTAAARKVTPSGKA